MVPTKHRILRTAKKKNEDDGQKAYLRLEVDVPGLSEAAWDKQQGVANSAEKIVDIQREGATAKVTIRPWMIERPLQEGDIVKDPHPKAEETPVVISLPPQIKLYKVKKPETKLQD